MVRKQQAVYLRLSPENFHRVDGLLHQGRPEAVWQEFYAVMSHVLRLQDHLTLYRAVAAGARIVVIVE